MQKITKLVSMKNEGCFRSVSTNDICRDTCVTGGKNIYQYQGKFRNNPT
jgi:hypothetical protein